MSLDQDVREFFPQLKLEVRGQPLVYLDSGATSLKPLPVIEAVREHLMWQTANVHRGAHFLSDEATSRFEEVREQVGAFVGAESKNEIVFTSGTTAGLNLVAQGLGELLLNEGDEILLSQMEHHSNIVPWQMVAKARKAVVRFAPVLADGSLDPEAFQKMLGPKVKVVSLVHVSNALGTINPVRECFQAAHKIGAVCVLDAAQSATFMPLKVQELGCDFLVFSGHKTFASTGVGVLYGRYAWLEKLPPFHGGGSMISEVREDGVTFLSPPHRFEAGTPPITEVISLGAALKFMQSLGYERIQNHERKIMQMAEEGLSSVEDLRRIGFAAARSHVLSFLLGDAHPSDVGAILDEQGIAVRAGHHCCQPLMRRFGIPGTVRASFSIYTSEQDIEALIDGVHKAKEMLL